MLIKIDGSNKEYIIYDHWETICDKENFQIYEYPPPEMRKGCDLFISQYEETVLDMLTARENDDNIEDEICYNMTEACVDIDDGESESKEYLGKKERDE